MNGAPPRSCALRDWLLPRVLELAYTAWDLEPFAKDCGYDGPPSRWEEAHGTYRTKDTILAIHDAMATGAPYRTLLDPLPADPRVAHPPRPTAGQA